MSDSSNKLPQGLPYVVERLNANDPAVRQLAASQLTDFAKGLEPLAAAIAGVVVMAYLVETEEDAAERQLFVLGDLCKYQDIPLAVCQPVVTKLDDENLTGWEREYIQDISDLIGWNET